MQPGGETTHLAWQGPEFDPKLPSITLLLYGSLRVQQVTSEDKAWLQCDFTRVLLLCGVGSTRFQLKVPKSTAWHILVTQLVHKFRASLGYSF